MARRKGGSGLGGRPDCSSCQSPSPASLAKPVAVMLLLAPQLVISVLCSSSLEMLLLLQLQMQLQLLLPLSPIAR